MSPQDLSLDPPSFAVIPSHYGVTNNRTIGRNIATATRDVNIATTIMPTNNINIRKIRLAAQIITRIIPCPRRTSRMIFLTLYVWLLNRIIIIVVILFLFRRRGP